MMSSRRLPLILAAFACAAPCGAQIAGSEPAQVPQAEAPRPLDLSSLAGELPPLEGRGDGRRTMSAFVPNLGRNLIGVLSPSNAQPLLIGAVAAGVGSTFDHRMRTYFETGTRAEEFGELGQTLGGSTVMGPATLGVFLAGRASRDTRFRAFTYDGMQATLVAGAYTQVLKHSIGRTRPDGSSNLSFPSGHTSQAFAWAAVVDHHYGRKAGFAAYATAGLIGVSRLERSKHFLSDVLAGATIGWVAGKTVARRNDEAAPRAGRTLALTPMTDARGTGAGLGVHLSF